MPVARPVYDRNKSVSSFPIAEQKYVTKYSRVRSTFPDDDDYLRQSDNDANANDAATGAKVRTYFKGGSRNIKNYCSFSAPNIADMSSGGFPPTITLYLSPNDVTWNYTLRTNVIDTYGGQVIQLLGVSIENLTIRGFFGAEGMWGFNEGYNSRYSEFPSETIVGGVGYSLENNQEYKRWKIDEDTYKMYRNGMVQFSEWFKTYFYYITQAGNFDKNNMTFSYPHLNWNWNIRPLDFPQVRFSNDELMPQWELKCDFIEDIQNNFQQEVTATAKKALGQFRDSVGFSEFIEWSEPVYNTIESRKEAANKIATKYSDFIGGDFNEKEIETLITRGFSYQVDSLTPYATPRAPNSTPPPEEEG